jgi:hypothetical protein
MNRLLQVKALPCIACQIEGCHQHTPTEAHHLNLGGKAGQKRRGDDYTIPLCTWHHRGDPPEGVTASDAAYYLGPSLQRSSKRFRETYGTDDELLERTSKALGLKESA